jgi:GH15 family glucan-1,4-alpha-glucosidase
VNRDGWYPPIGDYALLADCHSAGLVSRSGSLDWACLRRFDADSVFGRILDWRRGGHFRVAPTEAGRVSRRYLEDSLVLETITEASSGAVRLLDAFAMRPGGAGDPPHELIRVVEGLQGKVEVAVTLEPRFDYGELRPWLRTGGDPSTWLVIGGDEALVIRTDALLTADQDRSVLTARFTVSTGQRVRFSLHVCAAHQLLSGPPGERLIGLDERLEATLRWWEGWSSGTVAPPPYDAAIRRSAVVLKGLTCAPTGAIVAAPTTSLPERIGGSRNWDYRYSWIRDSTLALGALEAVGHREVAAGFRDFLLRSAAGHADDLQIMYGPYGERRLVESELDLEGYRCSRPVRIGNAAARQRQLDVYGQILDAARYWQVADSRPDQDEWRFLRQVVDAAASNWRQPDHGLWEVRGQPRHFVHSKVMCWVALDRGIDMAERFAEYDTDLEHWRLVRDRVREEVERRGVAREGYFRQAYDVDSLDASLLKLPVLGFLPARDPRMLATVAAVRDRLSDAQTGFVRRYSTDATDDGLPGGEGAFLLCTCWLVDLLAMQGETAEATRLFDRVLSAANDLGLFAEEYQPRTGELLGNFPQAFTHLGVIQSALRLTSGRVS